MKAIIIAGVSLFAAATIYGVADFAADKKSGAMDKLYKEETPAPVVEENLTTTPGTVLVEKTSTEPAAKNTANTKTKKQKKKLKKTPEEEVRFIKLGDFSRGRIERKAVKEEPIKESEEVKEQNN